MGTVGITPVSDPTGAGALLDLLKLLSDPAAAEAKLNEIKEAQARLQEASDELVVQREAVAANLAETKLYQEQAARQLDTAHSLLEDFDARQGRLSQVEEENASLALQLADREAVLSSRETTTEARIAAAEADIETRLKALAEAEADAQALKQQYLNKLQALREVTA